MLSRIAVLACALVAANAVQLEKCRSKSEPVFVDIHGEIEVGELDGSDPATWGPAEADAETAIGAAIGALAKGEEMTQGEAEAAFGGVVEELVEEVAEAGGNAEFEKNGPKEAAPEETAATNFIEEASGEQ